MPTRRTTFSKTQRERDKRAKAAAKRERRAERSEEEEPDATESGAAGAGTAPKVDEERVMAELAELHSRYDAGLMSMDDFLARRDELLSRLVI